MTIEGRHASVEDRTHFRVRLDVIEDGHAENFVETGLAGLNGVMQAIPTGKQVVEHLRACAEGTWSVSAQGGRKRRVVEVAILGFAKKAVAGQEAKNSIERRLVSFAGFGEVFYGLRLAALDEVGNAEFGDRADRAAEGGPVEDAIELFSFSLGHDFHLECCGTLSRAKAEPQE